MKRKIEIHKIISKTHFFKNDIKSFNSIHTESTDCVRISKSNWKRKYHDKLLKSLNSHRFAEMSNGNVQMNEPPPNDILCGRARVHSLFGENELESNLLFNPVILIQVKFSAFLNTCARSRTRFSVFPPRRSFSLLLNLIRAQLKPFRVAVNLNPFPRAFTSGCTRAGTKQNEKRKAHL